MLFPIDSLAPFEMLGKPLIFTCVLIKFTFLNSAFWLMNAQPSSAKHSPNSFNVLLKRVSPKEHRVNEHAIIRTFKIHFVATLNTVNLRFPLDLWDWVLPQTTLTLNLLRFSRNQPSLSAYASLYRAFNNNNNNLNLLYRWRDTWRSDRPRADQSIHLNHVGSQFVCFR
jgi:hypothetical protein